MHKRRFSVSPKYAVHRVNRWNRKLRNYRRRRWSSSRRRRRR